MSITAPATVTRADSAEDPGDSDGDARAQDVFAQLLREQVAPVLRSWGFRGSGQTFELRDEKHWAILGFQRSRWSRADELEFTVNVATVPKDAWESRREQMRGLGRRPAPSDVTNAGALRVDQISDDCEVWWQVRPDTDTAEVSASVLSTIERCVLPWLHSRIGRAEAPHLRADTGTVASAAAAVPETGSPAPEMGEDTEPEDWSTGGLLV